MRFYWFRSEPTKLDYDVCNALEGCVLNGSAYPNIVCWHALVSSYSEEEQRRRVHAMPCQQRSLWCWCVIMYCYLGGTLLVRELTLRSYSLLRVPYSNLERVPSDTRSLLSSCLQQLSTIKPLFVTCGYFFVYHSTFISSSYDTKFKVLIC